MSHISMQLLIASDLIRSLGWMLIHSLWIGGAVFVLTVAGMLMTKQASSVLRYNMLIGFLLLFLICTGIAGYFSFRQIPDLTLVANKVQLPGTDAGYVSSVSSNPLSDRIILLLNEWSLWIAGIWAIILIVKLNHLNQNIKRLRVISKSAIASDEEHWKKIFTSFTDRLMIRRQIKVLESARITIPVTLGHLRPVIIVPVGFFLQLPFTQVEAILFHELAHIYRRDYLVNFLQCFIETFFFFNPAILWLSRLIREQRELCCDDMVIGLKVDKVAYIKGLLAFDNCNHPQQRLSLSLCLTASPLARRLHRMIDNRDQPLGYLPKAISLLFTLFLLIACLHLSVKKVAVQVLTNTPGSAHIPVKPATINYADKQDSKHKQPSVIPTQLKKQSLTQDEHDDKKITEPADTAFHMASILFEKSNEDMANRAMTVKDDAGNVYYIKISLNSLVALSINGEVIPEEQLSDHLPLLARIDAAWKKRQEQKALAIARGNMDTPVKP